MPIITTIRGNLRPTSGRKSGLGFGSTGGSISTAGSYRIHTFQTGSISGQDFTFVSDGSGTIELLLVGGGGGGGGDVGGGGGGGGVLSTSLQVIPASYTVRVGAGGVQGSNPFNGAGYAGGSSSLILSGSTIASVLGGGGGRGRSGGDGGDGSRLNGFNTGGGGYDSVTGTAFEPTGGFRGANRLETGGNVLCGGGGGSGQAGQQGSGNTGGAGGGGASNSISGSTVVYGGGGGGSMYAGGSGGAGGNGGGGKGADHGSNNAGSGTNGLGGGGGGARSIGAVEAGNGGSGIVILRYIP